MKNLDITLTRDGRPLPDVEVTFEGGIEARSDDAGVVSVPLPTGRGQGTVKLTDGSEHPFSVVNAQGLRRIRVAVTGSMAPLKDPGAQGAMPSERYEALAWLGSGAMGRVLKARDTSLDRIVAVKVLPAEVAPSPEDRELFISEGRALARVAHPNLLGVFDVGINGAVPYLVVEYIDGPDLLALVEATGPLPLCAACAAGAQLCSALDALHQAGLVHRDVKPSNGLVDTKGRVVLADFGLVRPLDDVADARSKVIGTPGFMSPEHMQGQPLGPATDVYALGSTLYNVIVGEIPLAGPRLLLRHLTDERPDLREARPEAPAALAELVKSMMAIDPTERPSANEAREALESIAASVDPEVLGPFMPRLRGRTVGSAAHSSTSGGSQRASGSQPSTIGGAAGRTTLGPPVSALGSAPQSHDSSKPFISLNTGDLAPLTGDVAPAQGPRTSETGLIKPLKRRGGTALIATLALIFAIVAIALAGFLDRGPGAPDPGSGEAAVSPEEVPNEPAGAPPAEAMAPAPQMPSTPTAIPALPPPEPSNVEVPVDPDLLQDRADARDPTERPSTDERDRDRESDERERGRDDSSGDSDEPLEEPSSDERPDSDERAEEGESEQTDENDPAIAIEGGEPMEEVVDEIVGALDPVAAEPGIAETDPPADDSRDPLEISEATAPIEEVTAPADPEAVAIPDPVAVAPPPEDSMGSEEEEDEAEPTTEAASQSVTPEPETEPEEEEEPVRPPLGF